MYNSVMALRAFTRKKIPHLNLSSKGITNGLFPNSSLSERCRLFASHTLLLITPLNMSYL